MVDTGKLGSLREIEKTDLRSVLRFMIEYPHYKSDSDQVQTPGDLTDFA